MNGSFSRACEQIAGLYAGSPVGPAKARRLLYGSV
jgi:hypothetical protein